MRARLTYVFLLLLALAFPVLAQDRRGGPSLDRVLPQIARTVPGTFYDAEGPFLTADGRASYRIKWMTPDGRIIWFNVDARTGQVLGGARQTNQYRNDDDRDSRGQHFGDDRGNDRDGRGDGHDWNQGARGGDRNGDRNNGHDWNQGGRGDRDNNHGGDRGNNRGGHDRQHGG